MAAPAAAEQTAADQPDLPNGSYVMTPPDPGATETHNSNIIFLNACWGGCTYTRGFPNDSTQNVSSIVSGTSNISQFNAGQSAWDAVVDCVRDMYKPFNIVVTDEDPGNEPHYEAVVAGRPQEIGQSNGVGGVAPFSCGVINNAITFSFANIYGGSVQAICEVVAQESAHAFGLDHEYLCEDPMTYLSGCGPKKFRDVDAPCGEFSQRQCQCGGSTQNSVQRILSVFGPGTPTPPVVSITNPSEGSEVEMGFVVNADVTDEDGIRQADLVINNQVVQTLTTSPYAFNAPEDLSQGVQIIEVRATDDYGAVGSDSVTVTLGSPCSGASDCGDGETCIEGRCVPGPGTPGGLGEPCTGNGDCSSNQCASDGADSFCVDTCEGSCPGGFSCVSAGGDTNVCWPGGDSGGCQTGGEAGGLPAAFALLLGLLLVRRARREASPRGRQA